MQEVQDTVPQSEPIQPTPLAAPPADAEPPAELAVDPASIDALLMGAMSRIASLSFTVGIPTSASFAHTLSSALGQISALSVEAGFAYAC
jgi:hypothetical protein